MSEKIILGILSKVAKNTLGASAGAVVKMYSAHFNLVYRAILESKKGEVKIKTINEIEKNLKDMGINGKKLLAAVPKNPACLIEKELSFPIPLPRNFDLELYKKKQEVILNDLMEIKEALQLFINGADELMKKSERDLKRIKDNLHNYKGSKLWIMRNAYDRAAERLIFLLTVDGEAFANVRKQKRGAGELLEKYRDPNGCVRVGR